MKKIMPAVAGIMVIFCLMTGCNKKMDKMQDSASQMTEDVKDKTENAVEETKDKVTDAIDKAKFIGEEKAKKAALEKANITSEGVIFDRVELKNDDGIWQYEIEFHKDGIEYDADIDAKDGTVLSWEKDN